jgi:hypothetical protein
MGSQWGNNSLAPGASAGWFFARPNTPYFLPVLQVMPLTPSFTNNLWYVASDGYPYLNELGISTIWSQLSDDLSTVNYYIVVENRSNNVVEYAFVEADSYGPSTVAPPKGGLVSNSNYFLENNGNALTEVIATVNCSVDFVSSANGYSFQLNAYSPPGTASTAEVQQYVIYASPSSSQLVARIDTWDKTVTELNRIDVALANLPSATIPAGYALAMALTYTNDGTGTVTGAKYTVTDDNGKNVGSTTITIIGQTLRTTGKPATAANLAPINTFQYNIGGDYGGSRATLTSAAGTVTYSAKNPLGVVNAEPSYAAVDAGTVENANLIFGPMADTTNETVSQSFVATADKLAERYEIPATRRRLILPPPDDLSRGHRAPRKGS